MHGDTGLTPFSTGTYASRSIVMSGGAVGKGCEALIPRFVAIGAHLMQCAVTTARFEEKTKYEIIQAMVQIQDEARGKGLPVPTATKAMYDIALAAGPLQKHNSLIRQREGPVGPTATRFARRAVYLPARRRGTAC